MAAVDFQLLSLPPKSKIEPCYGHCMPLCGCGGADLSLSPVWAGRSGWAYHCGLSASRAEPAPSL